MNNYLLAAVLASLLLPSSHCAAQTGNVGIGTTAPATRLDIVSDNNTAANILTVRTADLTQGVGISLNTVSAVGSLANVSLGLAGKGSGSVLLSPAGGFVGIGPVVPHAPLHFSSTTANRKIVLFESANNDHQFLGFGADGGMLRYQTANSGGDHVFFRGASDTTSVELMRIKGTGNVGIGTAAPHALLQLADGIANRKIVLNESVNNDHRFYGFGINAGTLRYQVDGPSSSHIFFSGASDTTSAELMRIVGNGNVNVQGTVLVDAAGQNAGTLVNGALRFGNGSAGIASKQTAGGNQGGLDFYTSGDARMSISANGNVGIGVASPTAKLDVGGAVNATNYTGIGSTLTDVVNTNANQTIAGTKTFSSAIIALKVVPSTTDLANRLAAAYGSVSSTATQLANTSGNFTVSKPTATTGQYVLTFSAASGLATTDFGALPVIATLFGNSPGFITYQGTTSVLHIYTFNASGTPADRGFAFVVYKP